MITRREKFLIKRAVALCGAAVLGLFGAVMLASPAQAQEDCETRVFDIVDRDDSGQDGNTWAKDTFERTIKYCETEPYSGVYNVTGTDLGTFIGIEGEKTPGLGDDSDAILPAGVHGSIVGSWTATVSGELNFNDLNTNQYSTGQWLKQINESADGPKGWSWTYTTVDCDGGMLEEWVNAEAGNRGDITLPTPVDCPTSPPTQSPTPGPDESPEPSQSPVGGVANPDDQLPLTGNMVPIIGAGAAVLLGLGGGLYLLSRTRKSLPVEGGE